jgi:hypothetical protein
MWGAALGPLAGGEAPKNFAGDDKPLGICHSYSFSGLVTSLTSRQLASKNICIDGQPTLDLPTPRSTLAPISGTPS